MGKKRKRPIPARIKEDKVKEYYDYFRSAPVNGTIKASEYPGKNQQTGSTQRAERYQNVPKREEPDTPHSKPNWYKFFGILVASLTALAIIGGAIYKFAGLENDVERIDAVVLEQTTSIAKEMDTLKTDNNERISNLEGEIRKDMRHLNNRIDKYVSKPVDK